MSPILLYLSNDVNAYQIADVENYLFGLGELHPSWIGAWFQVEWGPYTYFPGMVDWYDPRGLAELLMTIRRMVGEAA